MRTKRAGASGGSLILSQKTTGKELTLYLFRKKQIRMIILTLILFSVLTGVLFHVLEKKVWLDNLTASNETIAEQVASIYELHIKNVQDLCLHSATADTVALTDSSDRLRSTAGRKDIVQYLTSLSVANEYIYSSYLYFPSNGLVFSSYSLPSTMTPLDSFYDKSVFSSLPQSSSPLLLDPRPLDFHISGAQGSTQVITMLVLLPMNGGQESAYLAVNIDAHRIYSQIIEDLHIETHPSFYILGRDGQIIFDGDAAAAPGESALSEENPQILSSRAYSDWLGWSFVLENELPPVRSSLLTFCLSVICILVILLVAAVALTFSQTAPFRDILQTSRDLRWRYFLTSGETAGDDPFFQFDPDRDFPGCRSFCAMSFRLVGSAKGAPADDAAGEGPHTSLPEDGTDFPETLKQILAALSLERGFHCQTFSLAPDCAAAAFGFPPGTDPAGEAAAPGSIAQRVLELLAEETPYPAVCYISSVRGRIEQLPAAWLEVRETEKYSWSFRTPLRRWTDIANRIAPYEFPMHTEKQLINTLLAGSEEDCLLHSRAIFASFSTDPIVVENAEIQKYLYFIQNDILSRLASMPMPVRVESVFSPEGHDSLQELEEDFEQYLLSILSAVDTRDSQSRENLSASVIDFIDAHYRENVICLNMVSTHFGLTNGQVSRIVREMTGKNFSVYITEKRIEKSKELLLENKMTVNEISDHLGFSYPYYFIRKFRELEGVTPGQYAGHAAEGQPPSETDGPPR